MRLLVLSAEAAAAATTRQPCETCVGRSLLPGASAIRCVDRKPPLLRFVPVDDDTYTEGERIQIAVWFRQSVEGARYRVVATATVARVLPIVDEDREVDGLESHITAYDDGDVELWEWHDPPIDGEVWWTSPPLTDHVAFVAFTPGKQAVELADVQPVEAGQ